MKKGTRLSRCWKYFDDIEEGRAECKKCGKTIAYFENTSNLMKHLRRIHKIGFSAAQKKRRDSEDIEEIEVSSNEGVTAEEEPTEVVTETNAAVHTIQAYRDVHGTTFLYLHPAPEGEGSVQLQGQQFQPVVASSESITANGEIVSVAVQKDASVIEGQAVDGEAKAQEEATPKRVVHAPVKNYQGSSVATRAVVRQMARPNPVKTTPPTHSTNNNNNGNKEDTYDAFGKYIASMLRSLPAKTACKLQGEIVNWILKEQMKSSS